MNLLAFAMLLAVPARAVETAPAAVKLFKSGEAAYEGARFEEGINDLTRALDAQPGWKTASGLRAMCRWTAGDVKGARGDADLAAKLKPNSPESFVARGMARYILKDIDGSKDDYLEAIGLNKSYALAHFGLGSALSSQGRVQDALAELDDALRLSPRMVVGYIVRGTVKDKLRQFRGAVEDYSKVVEINPRFTWARLYRARSLREIEEYRRAVDDFNEFLRAFPNHEEALYLRSNALFLTGDFSGAIKDLDGVIAMNSVKRGLAYSNRGLARAQVGDRDGAVADLKKAMELEPGKRQKIQAALDAILAREPEGPSRGPSGIAAVPLPPGPGEDVPLEPLPPESPRRERPSDSLLPKRVSPEASGPPPAALPPDPDAPKPAENEGRPGRPPSGERPREKADDGAVFIE